MMAGPPKDDTICFVSDVHPLMYCILKRTIVLPTDVQPHSTGFRPVIPMARC